MAPGKGLRGMLDNIVTDGMRVAAEVRRRMDEAQKELDRGAVTRGTDMAGSTSPGRHNAVTNDDEDDEDEGYDESAGADLLEGADAQAGTASVPASAVSSPIKGESRIGSISGGGGDDDNEIKMGGDGKGKERLVAVDDDDDADVEKSTVFER